MNKLKQTIISSALIFTLTLHPLGAIAIAQEVLPPPLNAAPTAPPVPNDTPPTAPNNPPPPPPGEPEPTETPRASNPTVTPTESSTSPSPTVEPVQQDDSLPQPTVTTTPTGSSDVSTGDSATNTTIINEGNINGTGGASLSDGSPTGAAISSASNGEGSTNTGSATVANNLTTTQDNSAALTNNLNSEATSGGNNASKNSGSDSMVTTGDANVSGTIINSVNSNAAGLMVSEFNVVDNHLGDLVLDFAANCISECATAAVNTNNNRNGTDSENTSVLNVDSNDATFQSNDANLTNNLVLTADSGSNNADKNTGGDSIIQTGDANVSANVVNNVNNNIQGTIVYGVVNIYGDLHGDIIFPEEALNGCCGSTGGTLSNNTGNGAGSSNTGSLDRATTNTTDQTNTANIQNEIRLDATTGGNDASRNTDGSSSIETGNTSIHTQVVNVANSNISGGTWWLVLVNEAGEWIGRIVGGDGSSMAGSAGTQFEVNGNGEISISNENNGADSTNSANATTSNASSVSQTNNAAIVNNLNLSANTGENSTSKNTNGNNSISTGDANVMANIVNFVNNNITGGGTLFVTVVNVFGSWIGDFVSPGQKKQEKPLADAIATADGANAIGGTEFLMDSPTPMPIEEIKDDTVEVAVVKTSTSGTTTTARWSALLATTQYTDSATVLAQVTQQENRVSVADDEIDKSQKRKINLAWLILSLPFGIIAWISKRFEILALLRSLLPHG